MSSEDPLQLLIDACLAGELDSGTAARRIRETLRTDLGHSVLDLQRNARTGASEVVYAAGKTPQQVQEIFLALRGRGEDVLVTRADAEARAAIAAVCPEAEIHPEAGLVRLRQTVAPVRTGMVAVISAGTSDAPIAEEAALTAEFYGNPVLRVQDVGVAGLHRLLDRLPEIRAARVVIVVAGMEGALPSVVGGLVAAPVIAVPTSVGYGAAFEGLAALLGMLNSCASGVATVNIDNGYGAGHLAAMINAMGES